MLPGNERAQHPRFRRRRVQHLETSVEEETLKEAEREEEWVEVQQDWEELEGDMEKEIES